MPRIIMLKLFSTISAIIAGVSMFFSTAFAGSVNYIYDDLNRLREVDSSDGYIIKYNYDEVGNPLAACNASGITINNGAAFTNSPNATITYTTSGSCSQMQFSNDNSNWSSPESLAASKSWTLDSNGEGYKYVYVRFSDSTGSWLKPLKASIRFDVTAPTTSASLSGGVYVSPRTVALACDDGTGSGCNRIYYTIDGSFPTTSSAVYTNPLTVIRPLTLKYFATDLAGNSETAKSQSYIITYPITTTVDVVGGGSINPATASVVYGFSRTFTITPDPDFSVSYVTVDGNSVGAVNSYTFSNVTAPHALAASFAMSCPGYSVKNARTAVAYPTLQAAYNEASDGDTILCQASALAENFSANRNITATIDGGYKCDFSTNPYVTNINGVPAISGGSISIKNVNIIY